jgi:hypothetical protein
MIDVFTAMRTKFLQLQAFWVLFFVLSAVVIDAIALSALKMNCLAHFLFPIRAPPRLTAGVTEDLKMFI